MRIDRNRPDGPPTPPTRWLACGLALLWMAGDAHASGGPPAAGPQATAGDVAVAQPPALIQAERKGRLVQLVSQLETEIDSPGRLRPSLMNRKRLNLILAHFELSILDLQGEEVPQFASARDHIFYADRSIAQLDEALLNEADKRVMRAITQLRGKATQFQLQALQDQVVELARRVGGAPPAGTSGGPSPQSNPTAREPQPVSPPAAVSYYYPPAPPQVTYYYQVMNPAPRTQSLFRCRASRR